MAAKTTKSRQKSQIEIRRHEKDELMDKIQIEKFRENFTKILENRQLTTMILV